MKEKVTLKDKFVGCIAGVYIGSAMGAAVETLNYEVIEKNYGTLDKLVSYAHYHSDMPFLPENENSDIWIREPGTTEDGVERQKLMMEAIIEKKDRITSEDLRKSWIKHMNPEAPGKISEEFEDALLRMAKTPMPANDIGKYCDYSGLNSLSRSCHPIGLINAGNINNAITDIYEVGQVYNSANSKGIHWAGIVVTAIAAATKQNATVDSTIKAILENCDKMANDYLGFKENNPVDELKRGLKIAENCKDFRELREAFEDIYSGEGVPYPYSYANEVVTKGVSIFKMVNGNVRDAIIASVNMGRDTDCTAAVAAGISGALTGWKDLPEEWIKQVDYATSINPYTCCKKSIKTYAEQMHEAFETKNKKLQEYLDSLK